LADNQVYRAFGELEFNDEGYTVPSSTLNMDVAVFAVSNVVKLANEFLRLWDRLHDEAVAGTGAEKRSDVAA
jgi:hypothetical protein